jgi:hypothetical protein
MEQSWSKDDNGNTYIEFPNWHEILCILKNGGTGYGRTPKQALAWAKHARAHEATQLSPFTMNQEAAHEMSDL